MELNNNTIFDQNNQTADTNENVVGMENEDWYNQLYGITATKDAEVNNPAKKELDEYQSIQALKNSEKLLEEIKQQQLPTEEENTKGFLDYGKTVVDTFDSIFGFGGAKDQGMMLSLYEGGVMAGDITEQLFDYRIGPKRENLDAFRAMLDKGNKQMLENSEASPTAFAISKELSGIIGTGVPAYNVIMKAPYFAQKFGKMAKPIAMIMAEAVGASFGLNPKDPNLGNIAAEFLDDGKIKTIAEMIAIPPPEDGADYETREIYRNKLLNMAEIAGIGASFEVLFPAIKAAVKYKKITGSVTAGATVGVSDDAEAKAKSFKELLSFFDNSKTEGVLKEPRLDVDDTVMAANKFPNMKEWYKVHKPIVDEIFGQDAQLFEDLLSITSQRAEVGGQNIDNAMAAYKAIKNGTPIDDLPMLDGIKENLKRYVNDPNAKPAKGTLRQTDGSLPSGIALGETAFLGGNKIPNFMEAMRGLDTVVVDSHMAQIFFNTSSPTKGQIRQIRTTINQAAKKLGWTDSETQAAVWALNFVRQGADINDIDSYGKAITRRREEIENFVRQINPDQSVGSSGTTGSRTQPQQEQWGDTIRGEGTDTIKVDQTFAGTGNETQTFFSSVTKGDAGASEIPYKPVLQLDNIQGYVDSRSAHRGNFDDHIAKSIPAYDDVQNVVGAAIAKTYQNADVLDIGASEGSWGKAITEQSNGKVKTVSLDMNQDMKNNFDTISQVDGATFDLNAFGPNYKPKKKFDVIHEGMVFQFISNTRNAQIKEVKRLLKKDGVFVSEEKFITNDFNINEANKDNYKSFYFGKDDLIEKRKQIILSGGLDEVEGMMGNMLTVAEMNKVLKGNFKFVVQFWDSGNFKGFAASDNKKKLNALIDNMEDTHSEYSTVRTPK